MKTYSNVDEYINNFDGEVKEKLIQLRKLISKILPNATETISYAIPTYKTNKNIVHFGGFKDHVSVFPGSAIVEQFKDKLTEYHTSKGTISFPIRNELPVKLIKEIVEACSK